MNMHFDPQHFVQGIIPFALILFFLYRRVRRNFGRQKLRRGYMVFRMVLLSVFGVLLLIPTLWSPQLALVTVLGAGIGVGLAVWAAKHTRFMREAEDLYYIPHSYTGIVVAALFLGRIFYRVMFFAHPTASVATMDPALGPGDFGLRALYGNPVSRGIFFILIGYYVYYYWFVLHESKHLKPEDMEDGAPVAGKPKAGSGGNI